MDLQRNSYRVTFIKRCNIWKMSDSKQYITTADSNLENGLTSLVFFCFFMFGPPKESIFFDHYKIQFFMI